MKPFRLSSDQARRVKYDLRAKDRLVLEASRKMNDVLRGGIDDVYAHYARTGKYKDPDLSAMDAIFKTFYKKILSAAVSSCERELPKVKRLAAPIDPKLPNGVIAIAKILSPKSRFFKQVMKRAAQLRDSALTNYLQKLRKQFQKVLPLLESTDLSPKQAKQEIAKAWGGSAQIDGKNFSPRVETIFRTESTKYFADAQVAYFEDSPDIIGFLFDSVRDTSRTPICKCRHGMILLPGSKELSKNTPPLHYNCRSHLVPLANDHENRKMVQDPQRKPSSRELEKKANRAMPGFSGN